MRVVLAGAASAVGQAVTALLVARGARVAGIDLHPGQGQVERAVVADLRDAVTAGRAVDEAVAALGGVDAAVLGLAVQRGGRLDETTQETWEQVMGGTLDATAHTLRRLVAVMGSGSSVVAISSVNASLAHPGNAAYAAAKGAVNALLRQAAVEYAPRGIRLNVVAPGLIDDRSASPLTAGYPMGRVVTTREVAEVVAFLASPASSGVTGAVIPVDAGLSATSPVAFARESMYRAWQAGASGMSLGRSDQAD
ncbi:SDR family oxidoreductase [Arachnia propionica]|uniref:SDR family oxidoreductase n=1 Tax=Arachnia propionica TaxID=1750 RepID=A0A3P1T5T7_9ACTN|nr:SDR family oxidoreductase [Arachnia propionica]RRD04694.1 SDR family oxidoreductase [Arachnia propionica]